MDRQTLESRIEDWPNQWKAARIKYAEAKALLATISLEVDRLEGEIEALAVVSAAGELDSSALVEDSPALIEAERQELEIDHLVQLALLNSDRTKAAVDLAVRAESMAQGTKITESTVEARVKTDTGYVEAQQQLIALKHDLAMAKLKRTQLARAERAEAERERRGQYAARRQVSTVEPVESPSLRKARAKLDVAQVKLDDARTELQYQARLGRSLRMLTDLLQSDAS